MLDQALYSVDLDAERYPGSRENAWRLGDTPNRWDVSFGDRLWAALSRWWGREKSLQGKPATVARRAA